MEKIVYAGFDDKKVIIVPDTIINTFSDDQLIKNLYITDIGYYPNAVSHIRERSKGATSCISIFCSSGSGWVKTKNEYYTVNEGSFIIIPSGLPHSYGSNSQDPWSIYWFHFNGEDSLSLISNNKSQLILFQLDNDEVMFFKENFNTIYLTLEEGYNRDGLVIAFKLLGYLLARLLFNRQEHFSKSQNSNQIIKKSIDYMRLNIEGNITLEEISDHLNYSVSRFSSLFKQVTGISPINYYNQLKIQKACLLLDTTSDNISTISQRVGIEDPLYFSRLFRKIMAQSPRDYRNIHKG